MERTYVGSDRLEAEAERLSAAETVKQACDSLVTDFSYMDDAAGYLQMPDVYWRGGEETSFYFMLEDKEPGGILPEDLEDVERDQWHNKVHKLELRLYSHDQDFVVATIESDSTNRSVIKDFTGKELTTEELTDLHSDLIRYRKLVREGQFSKIGMSPEILAQLEQSSSQEHQGDQDQSIWQPEREDLRNIYKDYQCPPEKGYLFDAVSGAIHSFGSIREWSPASRFNLIMSILGSIEIAEHAKARSIVEGLCSEADKKLPL